MLVVEFRRNSIASFGETCLQTARWLACANALVARDAAAAADAEFDKRAAIGAVIGFDFG